MQIKPPKISQFISLLGQDLVIKNINICDKNNNKEWVIFPPNLPCLRNTSLLWIQCVTKSMINYAINKGGLYMNISAARKQLKINNNPAGIFDIDFEYLILSISDLVQI